MRRIHSQKLARATCTSWRDVGSQLLAPRDLTKLAHRWREGRGECLGANLGRHRAADDTDRHDGERFVGVRCFRRACSAV